MFKNYKNKKLFIKRFKKLCITTKATQTHNNSNIQCTLNITKTTLHQSTLLKTTHPLPTLHQINIRRLIPNTRRNTRRSSNTTNNNNRSTLLSNNLGNNNNLLLSILRSKNRKYGNFRIWQRSWILRFRKGKKNRGSKRLRRDY